MGNNAAIPAGVVTDLDGNYRIINDVVDMGAYESGTAEPPVPVCTDELVGDLNDDCIVNILDFVMMTANWLDCNLDPQTACAE